LLEQWTLAGNLHPEIHELPPGDLIGLFARGWRNHSELIGWDRRRRQERDEAGKIASHAVFSLAW
jgi:hypothetical protein